MVNLNCSALAVFVLMSASLANAENIQVTLHTDRDTFSLDEEINLFYEVLWLGDEDGEIYFNDLAFPELQVSYLNSFPVEMTVLGNFDLRSGPSRHERRVWAPTMSGESRSVRINSHEGVRFLNSKVGYYDFSRPGRYIVQAVFRASPTWPLYRGQESDITSSALVIEVVE